MKRRRRVMARGWGQQEWSGKKMREERDAQCKKGEGKGGEERKGWEKGDEHVERFLKSSSERPTLDHMV